MRMGWLDSWLSDLEEPAPRPTKKIEAPREPEPEILHVWFQTRQPTGANDAGQVELGRYSVSNGVLHIHDEAGKTIGASYHLRDGDDPRQTAGRLAREAWRKSRGETDFNRPLGYAKGGYA